MLPTQLKPRVGVGQGAMPGSFVIFIGASGVLGSGTDEEGELLAPRETSVTWDGGLLGGLGLIAPRAVFWKCSLGMLTEGIVGDSI